MSEYYIEIVTQQIEGLVLESEVRLATEEEILEAKEKFKNGNCSCNTTKRLIVDQKAFIYDYRTCALCGKGLGIV